MAWMLPKGGIARSGITVPALGSDALHRETSYVKRGEADASIVGAHLLPPQRPVLLAGVVKIIHLGSVIWPIR